MTSANTLNFNGQHFTPSEFPEGVLSHMSDKVVLALFDVRNTLPKTHALYPSPLYGAHVRDDLTNSRHNTRGDSRLSDATDFFCRRSHLPLVYQEVMKHLDINGAGFYKGSVYRGATDLWVMVHIDTRPSEEKIFWTANKVGGDYQYTYLSTDPKKYFKTLMELCL